MRQAVKAALSDADKSVDFTQVIDGHVGQSVKQVFTIERTRLRVNRRAQIEAHEHIVKDQFGNLYVVFTSRLMDGEVYASTAWVAKPSGLVREWKRFKAFNDELMAAIQGLAFHAFASTNLAILKARHAANTLPLPANVSLN